jgi:membrane protease YdiL (CAAX protease family)
MASVVPPARPLSPFERPLGPLGAVGFALGFHVLFVIARWALAQLRPLSLYDGVTSTLLYAAAALGTVYAISRMRAPNAPLGRVVGAEPIGMVSALLVCIMGAAAALPIDALATLIDRRWPVPEADSVAAIAELARIGRSERIAGVVAELTVLPIASELLFRGALTTALLPNLGRLGTLLVAGACYALVSLPLDPHWSLYHFAIALLLGHARLMTGSLLGAIGALFALNAVDALYELRTFGTLDPVVTDAHALPLAPRGTLLASLAISLMAGVVLARLAPKEAVLEAPSRGSIPPSQRIGRDRDEDDDDDDRGLG